MNDTRTPPPTRKEWEGSRKKTGDGVLEVERLIERLIKIKNRLRIFCLYPG